MAAILVGAWPSILSIGAVVAIGSACAALVALVRPSLVDSRPVVRRFTLGAGGVLALELAVLVLWIAITPRRTVHLTVASSAPRIVRVVYGVRDGQAPSPFHWDRHFNADTGALTIIHTRLRSDDGWFREHEPHPTVARTVAGAAVPARWISGGFTQAAGCRVTFDEFSVGTAPIAPRDPNTLLSAGWLDSLSAWGIECHAGRLFRSSNAITLRRTAGPCYFDAAGGVTCRS
jgi:hypothetical protein